jgi:hypothetical protein
MHIKAIRIGFVALVVHPREQVAGVAAHGLLTKVLQQLGTGVIMQPLTAQITGNVLDQ